MECDVEKDILIPVLKDVESLLAVRRMNIETEVSLCSPLACDCELMKVIINNLIHNAVNNGTERTTIHCRVAEAENDVLFTVTNEGVGTPTTGMMDIFKEDVHVDDEGMDVSALGLSIVKMIAELHGGAVSVESGYLIEDKTIPYSEFEVVRGRFGVAEDEQEKLRRYARFQVRIPGRISAETPDGAINI
jgi:signal transduction histidine kinase